MATPTTVTRDELYRRVWSTPILQLAKEFGISDVALAKICRKLDAPRPPRGYWQQLEHGQKPRKARLPKARPGTRTEYVIEQHEPRTRPPDEKREPPPEVPIAENLRGAHPAARALNAMLDREKPNGEGMFYIRAASESCVRISPALRRRALLILDALARALEPRGHTVTFEEAKESKRWAGSRIHAKVFDESISLHLFEPQIRLDVILTPEQEAEKKRRGWGSEPEYVLKPSGKLILRAVGDYTIGAKWSDGKGRLVEDQLGSAVLGIERLVGRVREKAAENARWREEFDNQQRRRDAAVATANYQRALALHLQSVTERWERAQRTTEFLKDVAARVPADRRTPGFARWLAWAEREAERMDPIGKPEDLSKELTPDFLRMPDAEFGRWMRWETEGRPEPLATEIPAENMGQACVGGAEPRGDSNL